MKNLKLPNIDTGCQGGLNRTRIFLEDSKLVKTRGKQFHCILNEEACKDRIDKLRYLYFLTVSM